MTLRSCRHATQLASDALDRTLTRRERVSMKFHMLICSMCRRYRRQVAGLSHLMRSAAAETGADVGANQGRPVETLSESARARIRLQMQAPPSPPMNHEV